MTGRLHEAAIQVLAELGDTGRSRTTARHDAVVRLLKQLTIAVGHANVRFEMCVKIEPDEGWPVTVCTTRDGVSIALTGLGDQPVTGLDYDNVTEDTLVTLAKQIVEQTKRTGPKPYPLNMPPGFPPPAPLNAPSDPDAIDVEE